MSPIRHIRRISIDLPYPTVLASASPRRRELLAKVLAEFQVVPAKVDEHALTSPDPWVTAQRLAREKALQVAEGHKDSLVIAGDTVVAIDTGEGWMQLAKPDDAEDAKRMLEALAGRTHMVITGVCLVWPRGMSAFTETSRVTFRDLTDGQIDRYVATGSPLDKAGAYGLQDDSQDFIERVEGDVDNVIGLPLARLREALEAVD